mmetsp:Transcript_3773/g.10742  ORF Transcript_3773/g.10742 Transcript_3773/m.10742 type:complete len:203 (-) Transcript_3773:513-1121(-)
MTCRDASLERSTFFSTTPPWRVAATMPMPMPMIIPAGSAKTPGPNAASEPKRSLRGPFRRPPPSRRRWTSRGPPPRPWGRRRRSGTTCSVCWWTWCRASGGDLPGSPCFWRTFPSLWCWPLTGRCKNGRLLPRQRTKKTITTARNATENAEKHTPCGSMWSPRQRILLQVGSLPPPWSRSCSVTIPSAGASANRAPNSRWTF